MAPLRYNCDGVRGGGKGKDNVRDGDKGKSRQARSPPPIGDRSGNPYIRFRDEDTQMSKPPVRAAPFTPTPFTP
eukprot:6171409-Amphidinium_carterae.3